MIDAGFLELVRLGELSADDADVQNSLKVVDATIMKQTPSGPGWLRYNGDGYGDCSTPGLSGGCTTLGAPWAPSNKGTGHVWPVLSAERGEQEMVTGNRAYAGQLLASIDNMSSGVGLVPEQAWDTADLAASAFGTDPTTASIGFVNGKPAGSAAPLTWGSASQVRLVADLSAHKVLEQPKQTVDRYVKHTQGGTTLTVTAPGGQLAGHRHHHGDRDGGEGCHRRRGGRGDGQEQRVDHRHGKDRCGGHVLGTGGFGRRQQRHRGDEHREERRYGPGRPHGVQRRGGGNPAVRFGRSGRETTTDQATTPTRHRRMFSMPAHTTSPTSRCTTPGRR